MDDRLVVLASPDRARSLLTVRAAISSALAVLSPRCLALFLMCSYCRSRFGLDPLGRGSTSWQLVPALPRRVGRATTQQEAGQSRAAPSARIMATLVPAHRWAVTHASQAGPRLPERRRR